MLHRRSADESRTQVTPAEMKENFGSLGALAAQFNSEELDKLISLMDADNSGSVMGAERDGWECRRHSA